MENSNSSDTRLLVWWSRISLYISSMKHSGTNDASSFHSWKAAPTRPAFTCSKLTIEILEHGVKYVQS